MPMFGGVARYFLELSNGLLEHNIATSFVAPVYSSNELRLQTKSGAGLYVPGFRGSGRLLNWLHCKAAPVVTSHRMHEVWHGSWYKTKPSEGGQPIVTTVHDMIHEIFMPDAEMCRIKKRAVEGADLVICVSENTRNDLVERIKLDPAKVVVIYHGHNDFGAISKRSSVKPTTERPYFLFVGRRSGYKNFQTLLRAFAAVPEFKRDCSILCFGGGKFTKSEIAAIQDAGLSERNVIQISGSDEALAVAYSSAIALVYPSLYEGFGFPPLEAMSASCPVVCSLTSCLPEIVGDAAILFDPNDVEALVAAMKKVQSEPIRSDLVTQGHLRIQLFSWRQSCSAHAEAYTKLAAAQSALLPGL